MSDWWHREEKRQFGIYERYQKTAISLSEINLALSKKANSKWHSYSFAFRFAFFLAVLIATLTTVSWLAVAFAAPAFWLVFNGVCGYKLTGDWRFIGTTAKTDKALWIGSGVLSAIWLYLLNKIFNPGTAKRIYNKSYFTPFTVKLLIVCLCLGIILTIWKI